MNNLRLELKDYIFTLIWRVIPNGTEAAEQIARDSTDEIMKFLKPKKVLGPSESESCYWSSEKESTDTHKAYLICIEPIKKEEPECTHRLWRSNPENPMHPHRNKFCPNCGKKFKNE